MGTSSGRGPEGRVRAAGNAGTRANDTIGFGARGAELQAVPARGRARGDDESAADVRSRSCELVSKVLSSGGIVPISGRSGAAAIGAFSRGTGKGGTRTA